MLGCRFPGLRGGRNIPASAPDLDHTHSGQDCDRVGDFVALPSTPVDVFEDNKIVPGGRLLQRGITGRRACLKPALHVCTTLRALLGVLIDIPDKRYDRRSHRR